MSSRFRTFLPLVPALLLAGCTTEPSDPDGAESDYFVPADLGDGLGSAHAGEAGFDVTLLEEMVRGVRDGSWPDVHSILIYRRGDLVLEEYFPGVKRWGGEAYDFDHTVLDNAYSVTKSFTSAAVGLAIEDGFLVGVDEPVGDFFAEWTDLTPTVADGSMRLQHLLSMSSGIGWNELDVPYSDSTNLHWSMNRADDQVHYVLSRDVAAPPGTFFYYNSGLTHTLGEIVARSTGESLDDYLTRRLFAPLGIDDFWWYTYESGITHAGGGLHLRPRDMMKFGVLYLNRGSWGDQQLLPASWVDESTRQQAPDRRYGYQWWLDEWVFGDAIVTGYSAQGLAGQFIFVIPGLDLVVVFTGNHPQDEMFRPFTLMSTYVLPAMR